MTRSRPTTKAVSVPKGPKRQLIIKRVWNNTSGLTAAVPFALVLFTATEECVVHLSGTLKFVNGNDIQDMGRAFVQVLPNSTAVLPAMTWSAQDFGEELMWHSTYIHSANDHDQMEIVTTKRKLRKGDQVQITVYSTSVAPNAEILSYALSLYVTQ